MGSQEMVEATSFRLSMIEVLCLNDGWPCKHGTPCLMNVCFCPVDLMFI